MTDRVPTAELPEMTFAQFLADVLNPSVAGFGIGFVATDDGHLTPIVLSETRFENDADATGVP